MEWIGLMCGAALALAPVCVMAVMDLRMMQIKGEAVARGLARVRDGVWEWNEVYAPDWDLGFGSAIVTSDRGLPEVEFTFHSPINVQLEDCLKS
jgi:hypothetical protein